MSEDEKILLGMKTKFGNSYNDRIEIESDDDDYDRGGENLSAIEYETDEDYEL